MQTLGWYYRRLRSMSPAEVLWRAHGLLRDKADRYRTSLKLFPSPEDALGAKDHRSPDPPFRIATAPVGAWNPAPFLQAGAWFEALREQADRLCQHQLTFFDLQDKDLGNPIDWNRDHSSGKPAPLQFAPSIDYRDFSVTGDCKLVWEPNRHHHLVVLARAYRASGEIRYARALVEQLESWLDQCPFGLGMNWRSPLELGIRLINWVWAIDLIAESGLFRGELRRRIQHSVYLHMWDIARKYSRGTSANNHTIGEAAGVFIAASYFPELAHSAKWRAEAQRMLEREIMEQTFPRGGTREQAFGYHLFVLKLFLIAALVGRRSGAEFSQAYWNRMKKMFRFAGTLCEGGSQPAFGDCDDAYVLDLGSRAGDVNELMCIAAVLFRDPRFKSWAGGFHEPAYWLLGPEAEQEFSAMAPVPQSRPLASQAFPDSGLYLLQSGPTNSPEAISVLFDCGELGFKSIAAHGHADALSFTLSALGQPILVDPGTYDYFTWPEWREYFRSTRAHNTVEVDGANQSEMVGSFLWNRHAVAKCTEWQPRPEGGRVAGEHDGYTRFKDPLVHRRSLTLDTEQRVLTIRDELEAREHHNVALFFHLHPQCAIRQLDRNRIAIVAARGLVTMEFDPLLRVEALYGSLSPKAGWVSSRYHHKEPATTMIARAETPAAATLITRIIMGGPA